MFDTFLTQYPLNSIKFELLSPFLIFYPLSHLDLNRDSKLYYIMFNILIILFCLGCTFFYFCIAPFKLKQIKPIPQDNIFEKFVKNDSGYAWSIEPERKASYKAKINNSLSKVNLNSKKS